MAFKKNQKTILEIIIITVFALVVFVPTAVIGNIILRGIFSYSSYVPINVKQIALNEYGCDRVLWSQSCANNSALFVENVTFVSKNIYAVVAEKNGEEVFLVIPSETDKEKGRFTRWAFDYSFTEIIEKMATVGIYCLPDESGEEPYTYLYMELVSIPLYIDGINIPDDLDVAVYFQYLYNSSGDLDAQADAICFVVQIDHELKIYKYDNETGEYSALC